MARLPMLFVIITNKSASNEASFSTTAVSVGKGIVFLGRSQYEGLQ